MDDDLPESWRHALNKRAPLQKPEPREPVQPEFSVGHGLLAGLLPLIAFAVSLSIARGLKLEFPGWLSAMPFLSVVMFGNAWMISRAVGDDENHFRFVLWNAACSALSVSLFLIEGPAELYFVFLAAFVATRLIGRIGRAGAFFIGIVVFVGLLLLPALVYFFKSAAVSVTLSNSVRLSLGLAAAYSLSHAICTGSMPAERNFFGWFDAAFSGVFSSALGLFAGVVVFRTVFQVLQWVFEYQGLPSNTVMELCAAGSGLMVGNWMCVRTMFKTAYSSRALEVAAKESTRETKEDALADAHADRIQVENSPLHKYKPKHSGAENHFDDAT